MDAGAVGQRPEPPIGAERAQLRRQTAGIGEIVFQASESRIGKRAIPEPLS